MSKEEKITLGFLLLKKFEAVKNLPKNEQANALGSLAMSKVMEHFAKIQLEKDQQIHNA